MDLESLLEIGAKPLKMPPLVNTTLQAKKLGPLHRTELELPWNGDKIDMRLFQYEPSEQIAQVSSDLASTETIDMLLLGVSGCGKTSGIFQLARKHFVVYLECSHPSDDARFGNSTFDKNFVRMAEDVSGLTLGERKLSGADLEKSAKARIALELFCRLLLLAKALHTHTLLEPLDFLRLQINGGQSIIQDLVIHFGQFQADTADWRNLSVRLYKDIIVHRLGSARRLILAVDEANVAHSKVMPDFFTSPTGKPRGLLSPILQTAVSFRDGVPWSLAIAGTSMTLGKGETCASDIGKTISSMEILAEFPFLQQEYCDAFLHKFLPELDLPSARLVGRPRLLASTIEHLPNVLRHSPSATPQDVLVDAIGVAVGTSKGRLKEKLRQNLRGNNAARRLLAQLVVSARLVGCATLLATDDHVEDLMSIGLCALVRVRKDSGSGDLFTNYWTVVEDFAIEAATEVLAEQGGDDDMVVYREHLETLSGVLRQFGPSTTLKGNFLEQVVCSRLLDPMVRTAVLNLPFIAGNCNGSQEATEFWRGVDFAVDRVCSHGVDVPDSAVFLASDTSIGKILIPETLMRPDGVLMLRHKDGRRCCMTFGICLYASLVPATKVKEQHTSTRLDKVYFTKTGNKVNENAKRLRERWDECMADVLPLPTVRVHLVLPGSSMSFPGAEDDCGENDLVVYMDKTNIGKILGHDQRIRNLLAYASGTEPKDWG